MSAELGTMADEILRAALAAVEGRRVVRNALRLRGELLRAGGAEVDLAGVERVLLLGAGKAACPMALGARDVLGDRWSGGTLTTKDGHAVDVPGIEVWEAAHPVPDTRGLAGASAALDVARSAGERDLVVCLLSGGASALWPSPSAGVSLGELQEVTQALLAAGAPIEELNTVRKHLSRISGGQLARAAFPARVLTLAICDVVGCRPEVIASGPTVPDPSTFAEAVDVLRRRGVRPPPGVERQLRAGRAGRSAETPKPGDAIFSRCSYQIVARNRDALDAAAAAAEQRGLAPRIVSDDVEGEARETARDIVATALQARRAASPAEPLALLWGGETTVRVTGDGRGGRNQELALAAALLLEGQPGVLLAALGTDGTDGPTDAAGALVDGATIARGRAAGLDAADHLRRNDAYPFLAAAGGLLFTGPTATNVNDVVLVLVAGPR